MIKLSIACVAFALWITGCANLATHANPDNHGIDGAACVGNPASFTQGLSESDNPSLQSQAQMPTGKGGLCSAKVFAVSASVVLYRVFDARYPDSKYGRWWSLHPPGSSKADYRAANAICPEWSNLDRLVACEIRPGTQIVLGTTQSVACTDGSRYAKTEETQVFVANDIGVGIIHVGNCKEETSWP